MAKEFPLSVVIRAIDRVTAPMRGIQNAVRRFDQRIAGTARGIRDKLGLDALTDSTKKFGSAMSDVGKAGAKVLGVVTGIGAAMGGLAFMAVRSLVNTAATFEKYQAVLETIEGSQKKAAQSIEWVSDFAAKTPYELDEVMESFVKLRAYGIDPTNGTLRVLGDTAAAMGKPLMQAIEAIADAMTGENERLKEFGIRASKSGDKITYEYQKDGKTLRKSAQLSNRAMVQATLMAIWNDRYAGAMDKLSGTWGGMMSNLSDQWERFKRMIMQSGPFENLRNRLAALLERIDAMAKSGELQALADKIGTFLVEKFDQLWEAGKHVVENWDEIKAKVMPLVDTFAFIVKILGPMNTALLLIGGAIAITVVPSLYMLTLAVYQLGIAIMTTPVGWILGALALIAASVYVQYKVWKRYAEIFPAMWKAIKGVVGAWADYFNGIWEDIKKGFEGGFINGLITLWKTLNPVALITRAFEQLGPDILAAMRPYWAELRKFFDDIVPDWAKKLFGVGSSPGMTIKSSGPNPFGASADPLGAASVGAKAGAAQQGKVQVQVDLNNLPQGARVNTQETGNPQFELNQGYAMGGAF